MSGYAEFKRQFIKYIKHKDKQIRFIPEAKPIRLAPDTPNPQINAREPHSDVGSSNGHLTPLGNRGGNRQPMVRDGRMQFFQRYEENDTGSNRLQSSAAQGKQSTGRRKHPLKLMGTQSFYDHLIDLLWHVDKQNSFVDLLPDIMPILLKMYRVSGEPITQYQINYQLDCFKKICGFILQGLGISESDIKRFSRHDDYSYPAHIPIFEYLHFLVYGHFFEHKNVFMQATHTALNAYIQRYYFMYYQQNKGISSHAELLMYPHLTRMTQKFSKLLIGLAPTVPQRKALADLKAETSAFTNLWGDIKATVSDLLGGKSSCHDYINCVGRVLLTDIVHNVDEKLAPKLQQQCDQRVYLFQQYSELMDCIRNVVTIENDTLCVNASILQLQMALCLYDVTQLIDSTDLSKDKVNVLFITHNTFLSTVMGIHGVNPPNTRFSLYGDLRVALGGGYIHLDDICQRGQDVVASYLQRNQIVDGAFINGIGLLCNLLRDLFKKTPGIRLSQPSPASQLLRSSASRSKQG